MFFTSFRQDLDSRSPENVREGVQSALRSSEEMAMSSSTWQDHFRENLIGLEPPRVGSFLAFAIAEGRVKEDEYLTWASHQQLLPVLESRFFTEQQPDASLLQKRPSPGWNPLCFPVREWDGVLMVACLEKPELAIEGSVVYLLAPPSAMQPWWEQISGAQAASPLDMPDGLDVGGGASPAAMPEGLFDAPASSATASSPTGGGLSFAGIGLAKVSPAEEAKADATVITEPKQEPTTTPEPIAPLVAAKPTEVAAKPSAKPTPAAVKPAPAAKPSPVAVKPSPAAAKVESTAVSEHSSPSITNSGFFDETTRTNVNIQTTRLPEPPAELKVAVGAKTEIHLLSGVATQVKDFNGHLREALRKMSGSFEKTMFLGCSETQDALIPVLWSESFGPTPVPTRVSLDGASLFKIVAATEKSFHGPVVPNEINTLFFKTWNAGTTPAHVTLTPVFFKNRFVGALLGLADRTATNMSTLRMVEKVSAELTRSIGGVVDETAAA